MTAEGRTDREPNPEVTALFDEYRAVNNGEKDGDLAEIAERLRIKQAKLIAEEGHSGIGD